MNPIAQISIGTGPLYLRGVGRVSCRIVTNNVIELCAFNPCPSVVTRAAFVSGYNQSNSKTEDSTFNNYNDSEQEMHEPSQCIVISAIPDLNRASKQRHITDSYDYDSDSKKPKSIESISGVSCPILQLTKTSENECVAYNVEQSTSTVDPVNASISEFNVSRDHSYANESNTDARQTLLILLSTALIPPEEILITQRKLLQLGESKRIIDNAISKCKEYISTSSHGRSSEYLMAMKHSDRFFSVITCNRQNDISDKSFSMLSTLMSGNVSIELLFGLNESLNEHIDVRRTNECLLKARRVLLESFPDKSEIIDFVFECYKKGRRARTINEKQLLESIRNCTLPIKKFASVYEHLREKVDDRHMSRVTYRYLEKTYIEATDEEKSTLFRYMPKRLKYNLRIIKILCPKDHECMVLFKESKLDWSDIEGAIKVVKKYFTKRTANNYLRCFISKKNEEEISANEAIITRCNLLISALNYLGNTGKELEVNEELSPSESSQNVLELEECVRIVMTSSDECEHKPLNLEHVADFDMSYMDEPWFT